MALGGSVAVDVVQPGVPLSAGAYEWAGAGGTYFWVDPREELVGVMMAQVIPMNGGSHRASIEHFQVVV